ncbi:MAG TPA: hypothetical protein VNK44_00200 [Candidatus Nitrosotenuis sp.]|nr:hypothetical protein [Candidatus Nitrosotenuis sp.]
MYGIVNSFNHLAFVVGMLFSMKLYGPKSIIKPFNPATGLENIKFNAKFQKVSSGFSFLFWLALGAIIEFSVL